MVTSASMMDRMIRCAVAMLSEAQVHTIRVEDLAARMEVPEGVVRTMFADEAALADAIGTFSVLLMTDSMTRALVAVPSNDSRGALIALGTSYVLWANKNPDLYRIIASQEKRSASTDSMVLRYDASFVPLVRRYLGEDEANPTRRAVIARSFVFGLADLAMDEHFDLWHGNGAKVIEEINEIVTDFVDMMLAWTPRPVPPPEPAAAEAGDEPEPATDGEGGAPQG